MNEYKSKCIPIISILLILCFIITSCLFNTEKAQAATKLGLNRTYVVTTKGGTVQLTVNGTKGKVKWTTSDGSVAKVSDSGMVTAVKNGSVIIGAKVNKKAYYCQVKVGTFKLDPTTINPDKAVNGGAWCDMDIDFIGDAPWWIPVQDVKVAVKDEDIAAVKFVTMHKDGVEFINWLKVQGIKDGKTTVTFTIGKVSKNLNVIVETGTGRLDPVDAVKQRNYIGYTDEEAVTLKKAAEIIDKYNLNSDTLSAEEKIKAIQTYFIETRICNTDSNTKGDIANVILNGHGNYKTLSMEYLAYTETFNFFCDCLNIPCKYCEGGAYVPGGEDYINFYTYNTVEIDGKWYYIDTYFNTIFKNYNYFLSEKLWDDFDLTESGYNVSYFYTNGIKYMDWLSSEEDKDEVYWDVGE